MPKLGRPESGVKAAARALGVNRMDAHRAVKVASLSPEAKAAAVDAGLDDNRTALLAAAREVEPQKQVKALVARTIVAANQNAPGPSTYRTSFTGNNEWYTPARYTLSTSQGSPGAGCSVNTMAPKARFPSHQSAVLSS